MSLTSHGRTASPCGLRCAWLAGVAAACGAPPSAPPTDVDPTPRPRYEAPQPPPCEPNPFDMVAHGGAFLSDGSVVAGVAVGRPVERWDLPEIEARTDARGQFELTVPSGTRLGVVDRVAGPASWCIALPFPVTFRDPEHAARSRMHMRANNALVPPTCPISLDLRDEAPSAATFELLVLEGDGVRRAGRVSLADGPVPAPCDMAWALVGEAGAVVPEGSAGPFHTRRDGPARLAAVRPLEVTVRRPDGAPAAGARVLTPLGERRADANGVVRLHLPAGPAKVELRGDGVAPTHVVVADDAQAAKLTAAPARTVEVRCAGAVGAICPVIPSARGQAEPASGHPCTRDPDLRTWCELPVDVPAVVSLPGLSTVVPSDAAVGWIDLRGHAVEVRASLGVADACDALATRDVAGWQARLAALLEQPRFSAVAGRCSADGLLRLGPLTPGDWTVVVDAPGQPPITRAVTVGTEPVDLGRLR